MEQENQQVHLIKEEKIKEALDEKNRAKMEKQLERKPAGEQAYSPAMFKSSHETKSEQLKKRPAQCYEQTISNQNRDKLVKVKPAQQEERYKSR
ncbi:hypothetical protein F511_31731 [Dorcoceras hygrometricum]|uniref:Uncharacterized protein n=1 Tax=Dorcoceras hygrometricum TaxID=472368 RepID=A0A2Z7BEV8_9LAMI|nr:hypothetical protein F511_31731 [Dorcoceras hygrometricum]